jgi:hypothetical protein
MAAGTIGGILSAGYSCVTWSLTEEPVIDVIAWIVPSLAAGLVTGLGQRALR